MKLVRECWQYCNVNCQNVSIFIVFFLPHPNFAPLSPNITWARERMYPELLGTKRVKKHKVRNTIHHITNKGLIPLFIVQFCG